jgi:hypothetical protein
VICLHKCDNRINVFGYVSHAGFTPTEILSP